MNMEFIEALHELEKDRGISADILFEAIEAALISAYKKNFASLQNVRVHIDRMTGEFKVFARKNVVEEVEDARTQVSIEEARKIDPNMPSMMWWNTKSRPVNLGGLRLRQLNK